MAKLFGNAVQNNQKDLLMSESGSEHDSFDTVEENLDPQLKEYLEMQAQIRESLMPSC
jgi:hypothetical protein